MLSFIIFIVGIALIYVSIKSNLTRREQHKDSAKWQSLATRVRIIAVVIFSIVVIVELMK